MLRQQRKRAQRPAASAASAPGKLGTGRRLEMMHAGAPHAHSPHPSSARSPLQLPAHLHQLYDLAWCRRAGTACRRHGDSRLPRGRGRTRHEEAADGADHTGQQQHPAPRCEASVRAQRACVLNRVSFRLITCHEQKEVKEGISKSTLFCIFSPALGGLQIP